MARFVLVLSVSGKVHLLDSTNLEQIQDGCPQFPPLCDAVILNEVKDPCILFLLAEIGYTYCDSTLADKNLMNSD
jgi:hypothetical protein